MPTPSQASMLRDLANFVALETQLAHAYGNTPLLDSNGKPRIGANGKPLSAAANFIIQIKKIEASAKQEISTGQYPSLLDIVQQLDNYAPLGGDSSEIDPAAKQLINQNGDIDPIMLGIYMTAWKHFPDDIVSLSKKSTINGNMIKIARSFQSKQISKRQSSNPFSPAGSSVHQTFIPPTNSPGISSANPTWTSPHDTIAAANATANADLQNAINTGNMLDSVLQAGSGIAYGGAVNSDNQITNQPAPPAGNMAPQVQPGSGSQFVPPPPPDYSHMTGLGDLRDADMSAVGNSLLNLALIGGFLFVASEGVKKIGKRKKRAARRDRWAY